MSTIEHTIRTELPGKNNAGLRARVRDTLAQSLDYDASLPRAADRVRSLARVVALTASGRSALERIADAVAALTCLLLFAFIAVPASAQEDVRSVAEARSVFEAGQVAFDDGRYSDALGYFQRSYALSHLPELLFNIALCQDRLRDDDAAVASYRRYIYEMPRASNRPEVERRLEALRLAQDERALQRAREQRVAAAISPERVTGAEAPPVRAPAVYETWWFWTIVGVAVTGTVVGIGIAASGDTPLRTGDVGGVIFTLGGG